LYFFSFDFKNQNIELSKAVKNQNIELSKAVFVS